MIENLRLWLISRLLTEKERILIKTCLNSNKEYAINTYAEAMGETYQEFICELIKLRL